MVFTARNSSSSDLSTVLSSNTKPQTSVQPTYIRLCKDNMTSRPISTKSSSIVKRITPEKNMSSSRRELRSVKTFRSKTSSKLNVLNNTAPEKYVPKTVTKATEVIAKRVECTAPREEIQVRELHLLTVPSVYLFL